MDHKRVDIICDWVHQFNWTRGAELGVAKGRLFKHLVTHCPNLHLIGVDIYKVQWSNPGPERYVPGENDMRWDHEADYASISSFCNLYPNRTLFIRDWTHKAVHQVEDASLDFIFIDADHSYETCLRDIKLWEPKVRPGGRIIGHDINWSGVKQAVVECYGDQWAQEDDWVWWVNR